MFYYSSLTQETGGSEVASITTVLQVNRLTKCVKQLKLYVYS